MLGFDAPYVPGWDCHGLPIERKVDKELGAKKRDMSAVEIRRACRDYAERFIGIQREEFKRLGVGGLWERPYTTMSHDYEAEIARAFGQFYSKGLVYQALKSVRWCFATRPLSPKRSSSTRRGAIPRSTLRSSSSPALPAASRRAALRSRPPRPPSR